MMFGAWGETDHDPCVRIIHRALDAGISFIDTADVYARGESEEIVGKALAAVRRDNVVLATKFHGAMGDDPNEAGNSRRWIFAVLPTCLEHDMGTIVWSPLAGGWLSGKWRERADDLTSRRSAMIPARYDLSIPANQPGRRGLDEAGVAPAARRR